MKTDININIYKRTGQKWPFGPILAEDAFAEIVEFAIKNQLPDKPWNGGVFLSIVLDENHPAVAVLLRMLESYGWKAYDGYVNAGSLDTFCLVRMRRYDSKDLAAAEYFYSQSFELFIESAGREGGRWKAKELHAAKGKNAPKLASVGAYNYFVNSQIKLALEAAGMRGLVLHKVPWVDEAPAEYWEIDYEQYMPPCLLPRVWLDNNHWSYQEKGYTTTKELQFSKAEVLKMDPFDVAWAREELGSPDKPNWGGHTLIVSQRFRKVLMESGVNMETVGLRLVRFV